MCLSYSIKKKKKKQKQKAIRQEIRKEKTHTDSNKLYKIKQN